ncbi:hypothetical protein [Telmatospirillum siberiense]|uniref:Uncharacterized protein n=1 Tax=Telmatospirillum siberiense TaxID=382514 RepID=A0A2N3Q0F8_9PROT|nr:hypothetical protein [Telmatospirillum siberiense]PKU26140.1 hypothetical protein CWS72_03155 [Telmatospirillum siberiense]
MRSVIAKTFGGLSAYYYFRQFVFALIFPGIFILILVNCPHPPTVTPHAWLVVVANTLLYPYSRFAYEGLVSFILGRNKFYMNALVLLLFKFLTMWMCWFVAVFIAPAGLIFLYVYHSRSPDGRRRRKAGHADGAGLS